MISSIPHILAFTAITCYIASACIQGVGYVKRLQFMQPIWLLLSFVSLCLQGVLLHVWIDQTSGQNLSAVILFSLAVWFIVILLLAMSLRRKIEILNLLMMPLAALSIVLVLVFPGKMIVNTLHQPGSLFHILLSIVTFCVLCFAGLLAVLLAWQEQMLQQKRMTWLFGKLLPLKPMESLLFQTVGVGFMLLTVLLLTSVYFYHAIIGLNTLLLQKTVLASLAWVIFAILLIGRILYGWRGKKAIQYTACGVIVLILVYFSSSIILEIIS